MTIFPEHPWLAGATLLLGLGGITYTIASLRRAWKLAAAEIDRKRGLARQINKQILSLDEQIRMAAASTAAARERAGIPPALHRAEYDALVADATRARVDSASNMPAAGDLTAGERERLGRMLLPDGAQPTGPIRSWSAQPSRPLTLPQERRIRDLIREEIAQARAREMGAE